ncbi:hypothetical protein FALBO_7019 [Fusarium albosuccineum]|uniref:Uncharacterized protein n=1 Tax=Fusarium albosuccineum TaxID=1237068 RepID=A0A8H4LC82_9HYPO|nr:hypothetical protein FALBO_7019 [Fusarium albosuccineum]
MSNSTPLRCRTIEDVNLPAPATKLIVTQHLKASQDSPYWAWIIVGAFYDRNNNVIWSTEIFAGHLDVDLDSDEESSDGESVSSSEEVEVGQSDSEETDSESDVYSSDLEGSDNEVNFALNRRYHYEEPQYQQSFPYWYETTDYASPPETWDPTRQGPVPGYWQASFDPDIRRWVHTWQPLC